VARLFSYRHALACYGEDFDLDRYRAMASLLSSDDADFLAAQPGVARQEIREFQRGQRKIFRSYLTELVGDFRGLHLRAREMAVVAPEAHTDLVGTLIRKQIAFWVLLTRIEFQLALAPLGVKVDVRPLMDVVGSLGRSVQAIGPVPVA
jgi:hypothetical protein